MRNDFGEQNVTGLDNLFCRANLATSTHFGLTGIKGRNAIKVKFLVLKFYRINRAAFLCD